MAQCAVSSAILATLPTEFAREYLRAGQPSYFAPPFASFLPLVSSCLSLHFSSFRPPTFFAWVPSSDHLTSFLHTSTLLAGPACRMPSVRPPYPSFTLVMSSSTGNSADTSRLPAYRASHSGRYHPYSRAHPSHHENHMVRACDSISPRVLLRHWTLIRVCVQSADNCRLSVPRPADFPAPAALKLRSGELKFCFPPSLSLCGYFIE